MKQWGACATGALVVFMAPARAFAGPALQTNVSARQAEVGEAIRVELSALSDEDSPSNPRIRVPPGLTVQGPSVSSSQQISFNNGHFEHRRGITADWIVIGTRPGRFVVGPASVDAGGRTVNGETVTIEIVPAGSQPKPQPGGNPFNPRNPGNPFDPFGMLQHMPGFPNLDDFGEPQLPSAAPEAPPDYAVEHAPDPMAFLRATVTPAQAVVGEQVTLRVYAYGGRGPYDEVGVAEPSRADFLSETVVDSSYHQPRYIMPIDGQRWSVVKLREVAMFPLHAGTLVVGPMKMGFRGPGYPENGTLQGLVRQSAELHVVVTDPPLAGRPPGYELGDVGSYSLSAEVEPPRVEAGDAVAVTMRVEGTGNVPHHVKHTDQPGVEWLEPTISDAISPKEGVLQGWRSFRYVVRLDTPGSHDLGDASLPYFNPQTRRYEIARAHIGVVEVTPGKAAAVAPSAAPSAPEPPRSVWDGLGGPRAKLAPLPPERRHLTDTRGYWALLVGGPLGVVAMGGIAELLARLRRRNQERGESRTELARRALSEAKGAVERKDPFAVAGSVERAVYAAIEERYGLKARAILRHELPSTLERSGASDALGREIVAVLDACDGLRFAGSPEASAAAVLAQATNVVTRLTQRGAARGRSKGEAT